MKISFHHRFITECLSTYLSKSFTYTPIHKFKNKNYLSNLFFFLKMFLNLRAVSMISIWLYNILLVMMNNMLLKQYWEESSISLCICIWTLNWLLHHFFYFYLSGIQTNNKNKSGINFFYNLSIFVPCLPTAECLAAESCFHFSQFPIPLFIYLYIQVEVNNIALNQKQKGGLGCVQPNLTKREKMP